jgi:VWFA-related protein
VLVDAAQNKLAWSHWEQGQSGLQAVFSYAVPKEKSHYTVTYDTLPTDPADPCSTKTQTMNQLVAYHGQMAIDPASGTILRLVLVADPKPGDFTAKSGIVVEYAPVEIAGRTYFGPVKSVSSTLAHYVLVIQGDCQFLELKEDLKTSLNDVVFDQYHVFRADTTVLTEREAQKLESQPPTGSQETGKEEPESTNGSLPAAAPAPAATETITAKGDSAIPSTQPGPAEPESANPTPPALPTAASAANQEAATPQAPILKTTAREVVVDIVVNKGNGDPVFGLGKQDFAILEDGKLQAIDFFEAHTAGNRQSSAPPPMPPLPPGIRTNVSAAPESDAVNVLLIDTLNTEQQDQAYVHHQIMNFLTRMRPGSRVAIFMLGSKLRFVQGFTADTSLLLAALNDKRNGLKPEKDSSFRSRSDSADDAASVANLQLMQASPFAIQALQAAQADARAQDYGARAAMTFEALNYLGHYLAGVPGRKNLIWFASSFPVIVFPTAEQRERIKNDPSLPGYLDKVRTTADLFTLSKIAVYPIGAEGMMVEHIMDADSAGPSAQGGPGHIGSLDDGPMTNGTQSPFHSAAAERANIVYGMEQLAASTGGKAFFNTNDINGAIDSAINNGANYYTIGYSPTDKTMDGSFRQIDVKLANSKYKLAYRRGYNADDAPALEAKSGVDPLAPLLAFGMPPATGVLYGVQAAPATPQPGPAAIRAGENSGLKGPITRYDVDFIVRTQDIVMQPTPQGGRSGKILIGLKAYDRDGNAVNWEGDQEALEMKADDYDAMLKTGIAAHLEIDLPSNMAVQLVTAVYDWGTGKAGTLEIPVPPPPVASTPVKP